MKGEMRLTTARVDLPRSFTLGVVEEIWNSGPVAAATEATPSPVAEPPPAPEPPEQAPVFPEPPL